MNTTHARALVIAVTFCLGACKSDQEKQTEAARAQLEKAQEQAKKAQDQLEVAKKQLAESADKLGQQGEALGVQGAAAGMAAAAAGLQVAGAAMNSLAGAAGSAGKAPLVDFRALKALLPEKIGDLKRVSASGEKNAAMGMGVSQAKGKYKGDGGAQLKVEISDMSGVGGLAALGLAMVEVDKENEDGYEKTSTLDGNKTLEKYNTKNKRGELKVVVDSRFVVEIEGDDVTMDELKAAVAKIDLGKLKALGTATAAK
jgi:hypothetical protein